MLTDGFHDVPVGQVANEPIVELRAHREAVEGCDPFTGGLNRPDRQLIGGEPHLGHGSVHVDPNRLAEGFSVAVVPGFDFDDEVVLDVDSYRRINADKAGSSTDRDAVFVADEFAAL